MQAAVSSLACPAATGVQAYTGWGGFTPKAVLFLGNRRTTNGGESQSAAANNSMSQCILGMMDGVNSGCLHDTDDFTAGDVRFDGTGNVITIAHGPSTPVSIQAAFSAFAAGSFSLNWGVVTSGVIVNYMVLGGGDLSASIISDTLPTATGNKALSGAGFTPAGAILIGGNNFSGTTGTILGGGAIGFVKDGNSRASISSNYGDGSWSTNPGVTGFTNGFGRYTRTDKAYAEVYANAKRYEGDFVSMDASGLTLNFATVPTATGSLIRALCLGGISVAVGSLNQRTSNGNTVVATGFPVRALIIMSIIKTNGTTIDTAALSWCTGMSDGTNSSCISSISGTNGVGYMDRTHVYAKMADSTATTPAASATVTFGYGDFTLAFDATDATATEIQYIALGDSIGGAFTPHRMPLGV